VKAEIRGFEEGSRFIVVFRLGPSNGPMRYLLYKRQTSMLVKQSLISSSFSVKTFQTRVENRSTVKSISVRQSGFGEDSWVLLEPLTTENFAWEDPYGQKFLDAKVESDHRSGVFKVDMEKGAVDSELCRELEVNFDVQEIGDIKIARFTDDDSTSQSSNEIISLTSIGNHGYSTPQTPTEHKTTTLEVIIEMGLVGISLVDHMPKELSYFYLERVFVSYSTGYDEGRTSR